MNIYLEYIKSKVFPGTLFLLLSAGWAYGQTEVKVTLLDNTEQTYSVEAAGKLWFNGSNLVVNTDGSATPVSIPLSDIRKITFDGEENTTGVTEVAISKTTINIFPNPADNYFMLKAPDAVKLNVRIFNTNGSQVAGGMYESGGRVDIRHLTPGIYVVVVNDQSFKLIKQ